MNFDKTVLHRFNMPYALGKMERDGQICIVAATEDHGAIVICPPPFDRAEVLVDGPGGCMSLVSHPAYPGELYAIMGCFLGYKFHGGGLYRITTAGGVESRKIADLPFAHRMEIVERGDSRFLLLANLAASKDSPEDWLRSGTVYALPIQRPDQTQWPMTPILEGIHKNHGFLKCQLHGKATVLISGTEGLYALDLEAGGANWVFEQILPHEVSEIAVFDLDGDGVQELITIEPFHGPILCVYKPSARGWLKVWEAELSYGHCVLADSFMGKPSILVSNRAGNKDLQLFQFEPAAAGSFPEPRRIVVEAGVGAANMAILHSSDHEIIFATNQAQGELVRYRIRG